MAEFFPSNILDNVLKQLELPIFQNKQLNFLQRNQFQLLRSKLELIRSVIDEAEPMAVLFPDIVGKWVRDLNNVLHDIDDLLDEVITRSMPSSGRLGKVGLRLYWLPFDLTVAPKVKRFNTRLESIVNECYKCNLLVQPASSSSNVGDGTGKLVARRGIVHYHPDCMKDGGEWHMVGRDADKKKVIKMLFNENASDPVVWIIGMVGVGKTTLCSAVYNDEEVKKYFGSRLWGDYGHGLLDLIERQKRVSSMERKEKSLIVLDSAPFYGFRYHRENWDDLKSLVAASHKGSKILVTMELFDDDDCSDAYDHQLLINDLSEEHCWYIFEITTFSQSGDKKQWMIDLGKKIADKCCKKPSLLKAVGTLLYQNDDEKLWDYFYRGFDFRKQYQHYIQISRVSQRWPKCEQAVGYLKSFSNSKFTNILIDLYAALGFTNLLSENQPEFNSFFLRRRLKEDRWDDALTYTIDEVNEPGHIITWMAGSETIFLQSSMDIGHGEEVRHVAIDRPSSSPTQQWDIRLPHGLINGAAHKIRSLLFPRELCPVRMSVETLDMLTSKLINLRVLDLHDLALKSLPSSFGHLIHLRYVDLSRNEFKQLPKPICSLKNLQTLKLVYCDKLVKLPQCIKSLGHLKHLELSMCLDLTHMPPVIAEMTSLERLDLFVASSLHNGGLRYLKNLNKLSGHLCIELPRRWEKSTEDAEQANLKGKDGLTSVQFKWNVVSSGDDPIGNNEVLDKLEPCSSINSLFIINFGGTTFPRWITSSGMESHLITIAISHCRGCKTLPLFHEMPNLKFLTLTSMDIEYLQDDINRGNASLCIDPSAHDTMFFPSLSELKIGRMPKLKEWTRDMSELLRFSKVVVVEIWDCPQLIVMPHFSSIRHTLILQNVSKDLLQTIDIKEYSHVEIVSIRDMFSLPDEFVSKLLWVLTVKDCNEWKMFWANDGEQKTTSGSLSEGFQRLKNLTIDNCPALKYMSSSFSVLTNLDRLHICKCSEELDCLYEEDEDGMPWKALKKLRYLKIGGFEKLVTLPKALQHIPNLLDLTIVDCKSLRKCFHFSESNEAEVRCPTEETRETKLPLDTLVHFSRVIKLPLDTLVHSSRVFRCLKFLSIVNCPEIKYLSSSLRRLYGLTELEISKCSEELDCIYKEEEDGMPWKALQKLQGLEIEGFENLVALPKGLQHLRSLDTIKIRDCKTLEGGLPALPQLEQLLMSSCPNLSSTLPVEVLTALQGLVIEGCPNLSLGCNISHIPNVKIRGINGHKDVFWGVPI